MSWAELHPHTLQHNQQRNNDCCHTAAYRDCRANIQAMVKGDAGGNMIRPHDKTNEQQGCKGSTG